MTKPAARALKLLAALSVPLLVGIAAAGSSKEVSEPGLPQGLESSGEWVTNGRAFNLQEYCDLNFSGTLCAEWCEGFARRPTGTLCCMRPELVNVEGIGLGFCSHRIR